MFHQGRVKPPSSMPLGTPQNNVRWFVHVVRCSQSSVQAGDATLGKPHLCIVCRANARRLQLHRIHRTTVRVGILLWREKQDEILSLHALTLHEIYNRTRRFFPMQRWPKRPPVHIAHRPTEGWPGWVGLTGPESNGMVDPPKMVTNPSSLLTRAVRRRRPTCRRCAGAFFLAC